MKGRDPLMNNSQWIRTLSDPELADFLRSIEQSPDGPWQKVFEEHFCAGCRETDCDFCPQGDEIEWWLRQEVTE